MSEQQDHLKNLLNQRQTIINEIAELNQQIAAKRELALRATGAIEYLQQIGVEVPTEEAPAEPEAPVCPFCPFSPFAPAEPPAPTSPF